MSALSVVEVLRKARDLVARPDGWGQGDFGTPEKCCAAGAVNLAAGRPVATAFFGDNELVMGAMRALESAAASSCLPYWQDRPERTQAEVVAVFDKAILLAEAAQ